MKDKLEKMKKSKICILSLLIGAVYFLLKYILPLIGPLFLALIFVTIFGPLLKRMQAYLKLDRQVGAGILLVLATVVVIVIGWILGAWFVAEIPKWQVEGVKWISELTGDIFAPFFSPIGSQWEAELVQEVLDQSLQYVKLFTKAGLFLIVFFIGSVLLAKDYDAVMNWMLEREECYPILEVLCSVIKYVASFLRAQGIIMFVISAVSGIGLKMCGVPHGFLWGVLAGVLDALPFIGTGVVLVPMAFFHLLERKVTVFFICLGIYVLCILLRQILEPKLIGSRMGIPPIAVLFSIYGGVALFGLGGIVKGPLFYVLVSQTYRSICKRL